MCKPVFCSNDGVEKARDKVELCLVAGGRRLFGDLRQAETDPSMHFSQRKLPRQPQRVARSFDIEAVRSHVQGQRFNLVFANLAAFGL